MDWWTVLLVAAIAAVALFYLRARRSAAGSPAEPPRAGADHARGREEARTAGMSAEDRDWEAASQRRDAARREGGGA